MEAKKKKKKSMRVKMDDEDIESSKYLWFT